MIDNEEVVLEDTSVDVELPTNSQKVDCGVADEETKVGTSQNAISLGCSFCLKNWLTEVFMYPLFKRGFLQ